MWEINSASRAAALQSVGKVRSLGWSSLHDIQRFTSLWKCYAWVLSLFSCVWLFVTLWTVAPQTPLSMGFSRQEYWSGLPCPPPGHLPSPGIKPRSPALQADSLLVSHWVIFLIRMPSQPQVVIRTPTCKSLQIAQHLSIFSVQDSNPPFA